MSESQSSTQILPDGLDAWWDGLDVGLAAVPANPEFTISPLQTNDDATVFRVRMTSLDDYVITAWFSVPRGEGPFPALFTVPAYASVVVPAHVDVRKRYVTMTVMTRGQRGADTPYAAAYPGHLTHGIGDPSTWIYRGVMADMLRAYEVLRDHPAVDPERIGITGSDAGLLLNARRPGATSVQVTSTFWYRLAEVADATEAYPQEEINDWLRTWPEERSSVERSLAMVDPVHQADRVTADVWLSRDQEGAFTSDGWYASLVDRLGLNITYFDMTHEGQSDYDASDAWMSAQLGVEASPRSWQAEEIGSWR